jgi:hypothetical protein
MRFSSVFPAILLPAILLAGLRAAEKDIARTIDRLRSSRFEEREEATLSLIAAGEKAVMAAKLAALDADLEVRVRGLRVLEGIAVSPEEDGARLAEDALRELEESGNIRVAGLAKDSLGSIKEFRAAGQQRHIAALRKLGGVALLNESGEVQRIEFEGQYITDAGLLVQADYRSKHKFIDEAWFASKYVVKTPVRDEDLAILKKFPTLTYLNLQRTEVTDEGLVHLKSLRKLEHLVLNPRTTDDGLIHVAPLKNLKTLCLAQTQVTGLGVAHLVGLLHLEEIDLTNSLASDAGLEKICSHAGLLTLNLGNTRVTDEGAKQLSRLGSLRRLTLHRTTFTDAGLRQIATLDSLRSLTLDQTKVTDQGVGHLASLKNLDAASFTEPLVSKVAVDKLREAIPKANIHLWPEPSKR